MELAFGNNLSRAEPFLTISTAYIGFQGNDASRSAQLCLKPKEFGSTVSGETELIGQCNP